MSRLPAAGPETQLQGGSGPADTGIWLHGGVWVPRGAVCVSEVAPADLARIDAGSERRRGNVLPPPPRPLSESEQLNALCEWLHLEHHLNLIGVVTFTDDYAASRGIYSFARALDDVWAGLREVPMKDGIRGYPWKFVLAAEHHRSGRSVPHVHLALECPDHARSRVCSQLWDYFYRTRGRSRFEPMRDVTAATLYGLKDTVKSTRLDSSDVRYRLHHPKRLPRRRVSGGDLCGGGGDPPRS